MVARRNAALAGSWLVLSGIAASWATPVAAADCTLTAPAYVNVGTPLTIEGSGFPVSTTVDVEIAIEGGASDAFTVQTDPAGSLEIALTLEAIDIGLTTVRATDGADCTAEVVYAVLAAGATPPPATPEPEVSSGAGGEAVPPRTDTTLGVEGGPVEVPGWLALALLTAGSFGLFWTRSPRRR